MRRARWVALLMAVALVAVACGDDDDDVGTGETDSTTTAAEATDDTTTVPAGDDGGDSTTTAPAEDGGDAAGASEVTLDETGRLVPAECGEGTNNADEALGFTETTVNFASLGIDYKPLADIGFAPSGTDPNEYMQVFVDAVNEAGGVCGRTIEFQRVLYDIIRREGPQGCLQVTEDRTNLFVSVQGGTPEAVCVAEAGTVAYSQHEFAEGDVVSVPELLFMRAPSWEEQVAAAVQWAIDDGHIAPGMKVGVWYGAVFTTQGDTVESVAFPMLEEAGIDFIPFRTDYLGPSDETGAAVLLAAATEYVSQEIDVLFNFTQTTNHVGMKLELNAQGLSPVYISAPIGANSANALFETAYATGAFSDGELIFSYTLPPNEAPTGPGFEARQSCNTQYTEITGEAPEPGTFDWAAVSSQCLQIDQFVAALSLLGPEITQEGLLAALEQLPGQQTSLGYSDVLWRDGKRFPEPQAYGVHEYDAATNTYTTIKTIEPAG